MKQRLLKIMICVALILSLAIVPMTAQAAEAAYILKVTEDYARMRDAPDSSANIINKLRYGTKVLYLGDAGNQQCKVLTLNGQTGYVWRGFLTVYGAYNKNKIGYNPSAAALYTRDGENFNYAATLPAGQMVLVYKVFGNWTYVRLMNGRYCYMKLDTLAKMF